jgi:hypothetical protein
MVVGELGLTIENCGDRRKPKQIPCALEVKSACSFSAKDKNMTKEIAAQNIGAWFTLNGHRCKITGFDSFGGQIHFSFLCEETGAIGWIHWTLCPGREFTK